MATVETDLVSGPTSYTTANKWVITTGLTSLSWFGLQVVGPGSNLPLGHFEYTLDSPSAGKVTIKVLKHQYDKTTAIGSIIGLPAGVSSASSSGQTYDNESSHTHSMDHNHGAVTSGSASVSGGGTTLDLTAPIAISAHTHSFDVPNFTGNTGAGSAHTHTWDKIYEHQHVVTTAATDMSSAEIADATDLSGATFNYLAVKI